MTHATSRRRHPRATVTRRQALRLSAQILADTGDWCQRVAVGRPHHDAVAWAMTAQLCRRMARSHLLAAGVRHGRLHARLAEALAA